MQKLSVLLLSLFLIFGIVAHFPILVAEDSNSASVNVSVDVESSSGSNDSSNVSSETKAETETDSEDNKTNDSENERSDKSSAVEVSKTTTVVSTGAEANDNACTIKIERTTKIENGKKVVVIKKEMECPDGTKLEVKARIENRTEDGVLKERFIYNFDDKEFNVTTDGKVKIEEDTNSSEYKLRARLSNGNVTEIKVMPDRASDIAIARLKSLNFTIELREVGVGANSSRAIYFADANKTGRFFGFFKTHVVVETQIDPQTGEVIKVVKPWWSVFVSGEDSDQTGDSNSSTNVTEETNTTIESNSTNDTNSSA